VLVIFTLLGPARSGDDEGFGRQLTTHSSEAGGALALLRWVRAMGYDAQRLEYREFALDASTDALLILNPSEPIDRTDAGEVLRWVEDGGVLILVDDRPQLFAIRNELFDSLEVDVVTIEDDADELEQVDVLQPVFNTPPLSEVSARTSRVLETTREDVVPLLGTDDATVLLELQRGDGTIYVSAASYPFTNQGLSDEQNAALLQNMLRRVPPGGSVLFDEYHHGFFAPPSLRSIVLSKPWGWALLYTLALLAIYLVLSGRRFGRPVPLAEETARRSTSEYVESMADLFQRGHKRGYILRHYYQSFKRRLARPYGINPALDDRAFAAEVAHYRSEDIDEEKLLRLLARLRSESLSEEEMLRVVAEADALQA
jgi:hypothetical protein